MSVWVCPKSNIRVYFENIVQAKMDGCMNFDGTCSRDGKPCDAVEYAPRKRGKWIRHPYGELPECSQCHERSSDDGKFCPNCGAEMGETFNEV